MKCGLLAISQEAMIVGPVSYHDFQGIVSEEERQSIARDLKPESKVSLKIFKSRKRISNGSQDAAQLAARAGSC